MKNALYVRVSTEDQALHGYSLDDQRQSCRHHLLNKGLSNIEEYIDDGYSGEYLERPGLERLRTDLQSGNIQTVAIYDPDRLSRNLTNQLIIADEIEKAGAQLTFITGDYDASPEGRLFFSMKGAVSAYEKAKIRERTSRGRRSKAAKGKIVHNAHPFGYAWDGINSMYVIDEQEAKVVRFIYSLCIDKRLGIRLITQELIHLGMMGRNGKPLSPATVGRVLSKEMYCGTHHQFKQSTRKTGQQSREIVNNPQESWIPVSIPAIVCRETWLKAQQQLQQNKRFAKRNAKRNFLLSGLLRCGFCGRSMMGSTRSTIGKAGIIKAYYYYTCVAKISSSYASKAIHCNNRLIQAEVLEEAVWHTLVGITLEEASAHDYFRAQGLPNYAGEIKLMDFTHNELKKKRTSIMRWYRQNLIDGDTAEKELLALDKEITTVLATLSDFAKAMEKIEQPTISPVEILNARTFAQKRDALLQLPFWIEALRIGEDIQYWFKEQ